MKNKMAIPHKRLLSELYRPANPANPGEIFRKYRKEIDRRVEKGEPAKDIARDIRITPQSLMHQYFLLHGYSINDAQGRPPYVPGNFADDISSLSIKRGKTRKYGSKGRGPIKSGENH